MRTTISLVLILCALSAMVAEAQTTNYALGASSLVVGPAAGTNSVVLGVTPAAGTWTATANASWIHLSPPNQSGAGSTNVVFSYDANPGVTRSGALSIGNQTLTVTQAGSTYVGFAMVATLMSSGLDQPSGVAVDGAGNVYIADAVNDTVTKWSAANGEVTTLVSSGLLGPEGLAVDGAGNVYIADRGHNAVKEWTAANSNLTTLVSSGLNLPYGVALDGLGNVYIADFQNNAIKEWTAANSNVTTLISGVSNPQGVAVDGAGNVYIAEPYTDTVQEWSPATRVLTTLVSGLYEPVGVAVDGSGNVYMANSETGYSLIKELTAVNNDFATLGQSSGMDYASCVAVDGTGNVYMANTALRQVKELVYAFVNPTPRAESQAAGNDALPVVLPSTSHPLTPFPPTSDESWLTISGITNDVVSFSFTANPGFARTAHIAVLGQTNPITQAAYGNFLGTTTLVEGPAGGSDSVVLAAFPNVNTWTAAANATWLHVAPAFQSGTGSTNVIFSYDANAGAPRSGTLTIAGQTVTVTQAGSNYVPVTALASLAYSPMLGPPGTAVDPSGNVYLADTSGSSILEVTAANNQTSILVSSGLNHPEGVAVDIAGHVYIADTGNNAIKEWSAFNGGVATLVSSGLNGPAGIAVGGSGSLYFGDSGNTVISEWSAATSNVTTLVSSGLAGFENIGVDDSGNIYLGAIGGNANTNLELLHCFLVPTPKTESGAAGMDVLPVLVPSSVNLPAAFAPASDESWLTIEGITNGVVSFSFTANTGHTRLAHISLLGFVIPVTQTGPPYSLGVTSLVVGPAGGSNSVIVAVVAQNGPWTAAANTSWLNLGPAFQSGTGSTNLIFSYDANPGATRTGNLTIAGLTLTVTQAGSTYVAAGAVTSLVSSGLNQPGSVAVDSAGNVYIADTYNYMIKKWTPASNGVTTLISSGLGLPQGVAVDGAGNVYVADYSKDAIEEWTAANSNLTALVDVSYAWAVAVDGAEDGAGHVYIATFNNRTIKDWTALNQTLNTLVSGLGFPTAVAEDAAGNVYIADGGDNAIKEWTAVNSNVTTLVSGLNVPFGVAVDGSGNVFFSDNGNSAIKEWSAVNGHVALLASAGLNDPEGVAVDATGNVYFADTGTNSIQELPRVFVDPTPRVESLAAGNDVLPVVLPAVQNLLAPFNPISDSSWLTISGITNGVVSFSFTADTGGSRTAHLTLLGQSIPITQGAIGTPPTLGSVQLLGNGALQFSFTNNPNAVFAVLSATNLALPLSNWTVVGAASNTSSDVFQFTSQPITNGAPLFFTVRSP